MLLIELIAPADRTRLRQLRKRLRERERRRAWRADPENLARHREYMRSRRSNIDLKLLCPGVDLPLEAGTCGRMIAAESSRCIRCHNRRKWLERQQLNYAEALTVAAAEYWAAEHDAELDEERKMPGIAPLLDELAETNAFLWDW